MNLGASAVVLRPRTVTEVFDLACRLACSIALGLYARLAALVLLPCFALCLALRYALEWNWAYVWLVAVALASIAQGIFTLAAGRILFSETLTARQVLGLFVGRLPSYLGAICLSRLLLAAACLTLIGLPFAWVAVLYQHEVSLLEGASVSDSLKRSNRFVANRRGTAFLVLLMLIGSQIGLTIASELLGDGLVNGVFQLGKPFGSLWADGGSPAALVGFLLSVPYVATARFLHYIDARTRSDGWDVQLRFMAIVARDAAEKKVAA